MGVARVRVELKNYNPHAGRDERDREFKKMFTVFKKQVAQEGVLHDYREHEHFESKSRKRRRKKREAELARVRGKLKENFFDRR
jgi:ribosomal protein S21